MQLYVCAWDFHPLMANKKKYVTPTIQKNLRIPVPVDDWLRRKAQLSGTSQVDLLLTALKAKWPEVKGLIT